MLIVAFQSTTRKQIFNLMKNQDQPVKGFLVSCDKNRQKEAVRDAYNFIEQAIQRIYSDVAEEQIRKNIKKDGKDLTLTTQIAYQKKSNTRLLTQVDTHVNCLLFIKINPIYKQIDPLVVNAAIMKEVHTQNRHVTRYCHRIMPVQRAFRAQHFRMLDQLDELFNQHSLGQEIKSWMLNFKCRNNNKFNYKQVLKEVEVMAKRYNHFPDIYYPQWAISIEVVNHLMCLSICEQFKETGQFKLQKNQETRQPRQNREPKESRQAKGKRQKGSNSNPKRSKTSKIQELQQGPHKKVHQLEEQSEQQIKEAQRQQKNKLLDEKIQEKEQDIDLF